MRQRSHSNAWGWIIGVVLLFLISTVESGCMSPQGDYSYNLPNGYKVWRDSIGVHIIDPTGAVVAGDMFVDEIGVTKHYIYGNADTGDPNRSVYAFFMIDSVSQKVVHFDSKQLLEKELKLLGAHHTTMYDPHEFLVRRWTFRATIMGVVGGFLVLIVGITMYIRKK